ncbi:hypothetical protein [Arenibacter sp. S6351L]|uniref:hypothetical protein n=1 Tax=Arenibacter sp. S6351L TaxID=2926407 RepID=UPI001FF61603|nr:hypothetical protein [Arenibacter sp. S6351L]MCK0136579.1 hypothetical protein [Arenibacter sp. S6351L]
MKKKPIIIIAFAALLIASCIKDYTGHGGDKIELTQDNYLYEGDLYRIYLDQEIAKLDVTIAALNDIIDNNQADQTTLEDLKTAEQAKENLVSEIATLISLEQVGLRIPRPRPPCPQPVSCDYSLFEYLLAPNTVEKMEILILNANGKTIGGGVIDDLSPLSGTGGMIQFSKLKFDSYKEPITISVKVFGVNGKDINYIVE